MKLRTWLLLAVLGAMAAFAALNWQAFITPTSLSAYIGELGDHLDIRAGGARPHPPT